MNQSPNGPNILGQLRALIPHRTLTFGEALRLAELQANRLRTLLGVTEPTITTDAIASLPRIEIRYENDMSPSGLTPWHEGRWIIVLNASEPETRQRFSLAHEVFHITNHTTKKWLHPDDVRMTSEDKAEKLADYFAGCLLAPKRYVKAYVGRGYNRQALADTFDVSTRAIDVRLAQLGLDDPTPRCVPPAGRWHRSTPPYRRSSREGVAA
jgi:Zn-dependent peptidase ImmA (M78 family)